MNPVKQKLLVIGNGMVGQRFVEQCLELKLDSIYSVTVVGEEPHRAYDRVHLSDYFAGKSASDLSLCEADYFQENQVSYFPGTKACNLDPATRKVGLSNGQILYYDKLVLATGSYPFVPPIEGHEHPRCFVYRTLEDLDAITNAAKTSSKGVVIGGGLLGLEAANALKNLGLKTHVIEFTPRLMAIQLDQAGGDMLRRKIEALDITVHTSTNTKQIQPLGENSLELTFADDQALTADMLVFSAGIRPRDELARSAGLEVAERGGIVINDHCQTSDADIYAIGECASWNQQVFGLVAPGYQMAAVVAQYLNAEPAAFSGADMSTKLKLLGIDVASIGEAHANTEGAQCYVLTDEKSQTYKKLVVSEDGKKLLGAVLVGDTEQYGYLHQLSVNEMDLPDEPVQLLIPGAEAGLTGGGVEALPDSAHICTCHSVSKSGLCEAVQAGATNLAELKAATKAGTGCGGCTALVTQVLNYQLESMGVSVDKGLCEHFKFTRQELYHLVRLEGIKTFDELIQKHGTGFGCDICKPAVASILASCWNEYILEDRHVGLQDTNDRLLANMQKNGTYSVVPRVAGGEITADKLIVLGQVAKKYDLYTKITGGQRIDLFGATAEQLPLIWEELIEAGFETGHAYAKAVRTVKSCVGSIWCRYGVLDSTGLAIAVENRYKGLRAPHKLKFAVSGCTRECAEAQSKDVGIIATEEGWNLYVCGNGGMRPRHADLLATKLSNQTLINYIDRFLMFYVQTADRLQRTSVWLENIEGGIDYVRQVVCKDSLGIASELEQQMQHIVDSYQCEWKTTISDERNRKHFNPFINAPKQSTVVAFERERGQIKPMENPPSGVKPVSKDKDHDYAYIKC